MVPSAIAVTTPSRTRRITSAMSSCGSSGSPQTHVYIGDLSAFSVRTSKTSSHANSCGFTRDLGDASVLLCAEVDAGPAVAAQGRQDQSHGKRQEPHDYRRRGLRRARRRGEGHQERAVLAHPGVPRPAGGNSDCFCNGGYWRVGLTPTFVRPPCPCSSIINMTRPPYVIVSMSTDLVLLYGE